MKIQAPPGMRDFYPDDMRLQNWLFDAWRRTSRAFGFQEYEGPIFESLDLYTVKSGPEIVSQLFNFGDRGGRRFAIRPEMTPTLARMVAARANALPRPIKWFSIPRMCRAERPQRGRLREFFQWNVDVLGADDPLADAEVIATAISFLRSVGATAADFVVELNSRGLAAARLESLGLRPEDTAPAFDLIDKVDRLPPAEFERQWTAAFGDRLSLDRLQREFLETDPLADSSGHPQQAAFRAVWEQLGRLGVQEFCRPNAKLARGLAYYTGVVFEIRDRGGRLRALAGGGRYDNLCELLDGPPIGGVGFGMGDVPILEFLRDLNRLPSVSHRVDVFVIDASEGAFPAVLQAVARLRDSGLIVEFSYKRAALGKQLKQAASLNARFAILIDAERHAAGHVTIKDMSTGEQSDESLDAVEARIRSAISQGGASVWPNPK